MKKFLLALLTAVTAAALFCGAAAPVATYSASYDAPAGINAIVVQDNSAAVILQAADIDHIRADYTYTSSYAFESSKLYDFTVAGSTLTVTKTREPNASLIIQSEDTRSCTLTLQVPRQTLANITVSTTNDSITLAGVSAQTASLTTDNGRIEVSNFNGSTLSGTTRNGKITMSGVTYTSLAVSYDNDTIEEMIGGRAYGGRSDCYIIHPNGDIMLSEEPKSEITAWMENLFDYLETNTEVNETCLREMQEQTLQGGSGSVPYRFKGRNYYLVYQPVGFQDLTIVGIVERNVVDAGMRKVQCVTIFLLAFLALAVVAALVRSIKTDLRFVLAEQEEAFHRESTERQKMEDLANTDGLTGLSNERFFNATLQKKEKAGEPFALFYLDLDSFKPVNDTYGHDVGDQLLKAVAWRLRTCVRSTDYAFRIGGDEFALIVNGALSEEFCAKRTERIKNVLTQPFVINGQELHIGTSCGSALYPADSTEVKDIRILADQRMYEDKAHKPGRQGR